MFSDPYFPDNLVEKGKGILINFCEQIEATKPQNLDALYVLSHQATESFNDLAEEFNEQDSDIETVARECICEDLYNIAQAYGFDADIEELAAPRDW